jgi:lipopolysaccharide/colanic/teichoic acid biosynthesis glycosyltransferase
MIFRTRRKNESVFKRILKPWAHVPPPGHQNVLTPKQFEREVARERFRANRRDGSNREFAIVSIDFAEVVKDEVLEQLIYEFSDRIRISDSIGWHQLRLAVLLPETVKGGAYLVASGLVEIANELDVDIQTEVSVYPWDDKLVSQSSEHLKQFDQDNDDDGAPGAGDGPSDGGYEVFESESGTYTRTDGPHSMKSVDRGGSSGSISATAVSELAQAQPKIVSPNGKATSLDLEIAKRGTGSELSFLPALKTPVWKRVIDLAGSGMGLIALSPLLMFTAVAIKLTSRGPVFFRQEREGVDGKTFEILKFRTMIVDAEDKKDALRQYSEQDGPAFKLTNDPRVTPIGRYLRKSCIDELPQLINVLSGEMSLVGPRPLPVGESQQCLAWQRQRLSVLPGLTCIWQAREDRDTKFIEWMRMDMEYIRQRGFWFDMKLIYKTALVVVLHRGSA